MHISYIPPEVKYLTRLKKLAIGYNRIQHFDTVCQLTQLKSLFLRRNIINFLPEGVLIMTNLNALAVSSNEPLRYLP